MEEIEKSLGDPQENLRVENEILKLKLSAEYGMHFNESLDEQVEPELENVFLENMMEFEKAYAASKTTTLYENLGRPEIIPAGLLDKDGLSREIKKWLNLFQENCIHLDFVHGPYPDDVVYRFITEEFLHYEINIIKAKNFFQGFIYEEYHPNHKEEIRRSVTDFFKSWIEKDFNEYTPALSSYMLSPGGKKYNMEEFKQKITNYFEAFREFRDENFDIANIEFELIEGNEELKGLAFAEGTGRYEAMTESGDALHFEGSFKIFLSRKWDSWHINSFIMPGFVWE